MENKDQKHSYWSLHYKLKLSDVMGICFQDFTKQFKEFFKQNFPIYENHMFLNLDKCQYILTGILV